MLLRLPFLALLELLRLFLLMWMSVSQISSLTFGAQLVLNLKTDKGDFFLIHALMHLFRVQSRLRAVHRYHSSFRAYISPDRRESFDIRLAFSVLLRISSHRSQGPLHRPLYYRFPGVSQTQGLDRNIALLPFFLQSERVPSLQSRL